MRLARTFPLTVAHIFLDVRLVCAHFCNEWLLIYIRGYSMNLSAQIVHKMKP